MLLAIDPQAKKKKGAAPAAEVTWDGTALRVPPALLERWRAAFPGIDVAAQIRLAEAWILDHPARAQKKQWARFLTNWLQRTKPGDHSAPPDAAPGDPAPPPPPPREPEGWRLAYVDLYEQDPLAPWAQQPDAVQRECRAWLAENADRSAA